MDGGQPFAVNRPRRRDRDGDTLMAELRHQGALTCRCILGVQEYSNSPFIISEKTRANDILSAVNKLR